MSAGRRHAVLQRECLEDLRYWVDVSPKTAHRVLALMEATLRDPHAGAGKPVRMEAMNGDVWSRRINEVDRLVYEVFADRVEFLVARYHYSLAEELSAKPMSEYIAERAARGDRKKFDQVLRKVRAAGHAPAPGGTPE
ncbi:MAG: Addiction module toxin, Txe/YoeB [Gemmatimonadetes bacterium]|nr:Addiction module toxin, Txe/YoeB [Gemmatimonadota bacterium]